MAIWSGFLNATAFFLNVTAFYLKHNRVLNKCRGVCGKIVFYSLNNNSFTYICKLINLCTYENNFCVCIMPTVYVKCIGSMEACR